MRWFNAFALTFVLCSISASRMTFAASDRSINTDKDKNPPVRMLGIEGIAAPTGESTYVAKYGIAAGFRASELNYFSIKAVATKATGMGSSIGQGSSGDSSVLGTTWTTKSQAYKVTIHEEFFPPQLAGKFYLLVGPAFQKESYRVQIASTNAAGQKEPSFGYDATTFGLDAGFGVRNIIGGSTYIGVEIFEYYRPLKRLSFEETGAVPAILSSESFDTPMKPRYKVLSLQYGFVF